MASKRLQTMKKALLAPLTQENYVFKLLEPSHTEDVIRLLGEEFQSQEPLSNAYYRSFPLEKQQRISNWS